MPLAAVLGPRAHAPLEQHLLFRSRDLEEARERVSDVYCPHELRFAGTARHEGDTLMAHLPIGAVSLNRLRYGARVRIDAGRLERFLLVMMPLAGQAEIGCGDEQIHSTPRLASVVTPTRPLRETVEANCDQIMVRIDRALLESRCERHLGHALDQPLAFRLGMDLQDPRNHGWLQLVAWLVGSAETGSPLPASPLLRAQTEEMIATTLLLTQPHSYSAALAEPAAPIAPRHVRRVEDYIRAHADEPLTVSALAAEVGVSTRALQAGFRDFRGTTPMAYLKSVRLERAREALTQANPATDRVSSVALRWGFQHLGHFSAGYRRRFGESPSETLRRG